MQFKVPQFLDIEDKIFGPFTFRQFVYLAGGAGMCFVLYRLLGFFWGLVPILLLGGFALALAFYRPNDKPFILMVEAATKYLLQSKLYIWKKEERKIESKKSPTKAPLPLTNTYQRRAEGRLTGEKLRDLAWSLDILDLSKSAVSGEVKQNNISNI